MLLSHDFFQLVKYHRNQLFFVISCFKSCSPSQNELERSNHKLNEMSNLNLRVAQLEEEKIQLEELNGKLVGDLEETQKHVQEETDRIAAEKCQEIEKIKWEWQKEKNVSKVTFTP